MSRSRLDAIRLACANPRRSAAFYATAFGFTVAARGPGPASGAASRAASGAASGVTRLRLGRQSIELVATHRPGLAVAASDSTAFQHFAIIVSDMDAAMRRLRRVPGWRPISSAGPVTLPAESGGVVAFKFTDPDGHPLELLAFPEGGAPSIWRRAMARPGAGTCLGIDHTAMTVTDTDRSIGFWRGLGFTVMERRINRGIEQARLDGLDDLDGPASPDSPGKAREVRVEVTGLRPPGGAPPHLELLCYLAPGTRTVRVRAGNRLATRTVLSGGIGTGRRTARDPDGHRLVSADAPRSGPPRAARSRRS